MSGDLQRSQELLRLLEGHQTAPTALGLAAYHLACSEIDACADATEWAIADRHPAIFYFLHAHAHTLRRSSRWPAIAKLLNLTG